MRPIVKPLEVESVLCVAIAAIASYSDVSILTHAGLVLTGVSWSAAAMATEMDHGRLEFSYLPKQIEWPRCPPRHEVEPIAVSAPLELYLDCPGLLVERKAIGS
jgi:hypothetical protein